MKKTLSTKQTRPTLNWQTGAYDRMLQLQTHLPYQFLLLCRLMNTTPEQILLDFMDNLACGSWKREGRDEAKTYLIDYFIAHGYGRQQYTEADIRQMFKEMDAMGMLFPTNGGPNLINRYAKWRKGHYTYWFKKWFRKPRSKKSG